MVLVPEDLRISKVGTIGLQDGIAFVYLEVVTVIIRVSNCLNLLHWPSYSIDRYDTIRLIREEARSIVDINYCRSRKDVCCAVLRCKCNRLIGPVVQIARCSMTPVEASARTSSALKVIVKGQTLISDIPMLITRNRLPWVVLVV